VSSADKRYHPFSPAIIEPSYSLAAKKSLTEDRNIFAPAITSEASFSLAT